MSEDQKKNFTEENSQRREILKALATIPVLGLFFANLLEKYRREAIKKSNILKDLVKEKNVPNVIKKISNSDHLNIGIIGYGGRGGHLVRGAGFATKGWIDYATDAQKENKLHKALATFMSQEDLNCSLIGACDLFDINLELAVDASKNEIRPGGKPKGIAKKYKDYRELLADDDIDAVIIATPDHWHSKITTDAAKAGKHVYCEKGLTRTFDEAIDVYDTVKEAGITFQLGHQNRQVEANEQARKIIEQGLLGPVNLVELTTNRNSSWGAWVWNIHEKANSKTIDWDMFQKPAPNKIPFGEEALKRFFRWRSPTRFDRTRRPGRHPGFDDCASAYPGIGHTVGDQRHALPGDSLNGRSNRSCHGLLSLSDTATYHHTIQAGSQRLHHPTDSAQRQ